MWVNFGSGDCRNLPKVVCRAHVPVCLYDEIPKIIIY